MKNYLVIALFTAVFAINSFADRTTRYWDACKPSCAWTGNAKDSPNGVATACSVNGSKLSDASAKNACEAGGTAYTCMGQAPWAVDDNTAYGFAASHTNSDCGKCFQLTFTDNGEGGTTGGSISGKKMVVMISNIGGDVAGNQFDIMIPGGGVGNFDALSTQISQNGGSSSNLGQQYGGFRATCGNNATCVQNMCDVAFNGTGLADLKKGCNWFITWYKIANNPNVNSSQITCPQALIDAYKNGNGGGSNPTPTPTPSSSSAGNSGGGNSSNSSGGSNCGTTVTIGTGAETKVEAECYVNKNGANLVTSTENGITNIGYIENGYSTTYRVNAPSGRAGQYTMQFRIASEQQINFTVKVNNTNVGNISRGGTGGWNTYFTESLVSKAQLNTGDNTIVLEFGGAVNVDYFLLVGTAVTPSSSSAAISSSSSVAPPVPIRSPQIVSGNIRVQAIDNSIMLENLPQNAKIEAYNLQGKQIYSNYSENSKILRILVQTKGMYIIKIKFGSETKLLRVPVM